MNSTFLSALCWRVVVAAAITLFSHAVLLAQCAQDTVPPVIQFKPNPIIIYVDVNALDNPYVHVSDFEAGSSDNCTPHDSLVFRIEFLNRNFLEACTQIFPKTTLPLSDSCKANEMCFSGYRIWAIDKAGNTSYKDWFLKAGGPFRFLQTNQALCSNGDPAFSITGKVQTSKGVLLENVELNSRFTLDNAPTIFQHKGKTAIGYYSISPGFSYSKICHASVKARKITKQKSDYTQGISTYDLVLLHQHVLNIAPFTSPYQRIAGDINNSGTLSTLDVVWLRKLILGVIDSFPNSKTWRFVPETFVFPDPNNPWKTGIPDSVVVENTFSGVANFIGIKIGDLNFSAVAEVEKTPPLPSIFPLELENRQFKAHERVEIPVFAAANLDIVGYQGTLEYDTNALELVEIVGEKDNFALHQDGKITFSEIRQPKQGEELFRLIFRSKQQGTVLNTLKLSDAITKREAYRKDGFTMPPTLSTPYYSNRPAMIRPL
jgi:hypothetical protein